MPGSCNTIWALVVELLLTLCTFAMKKNCLKVDQHNTIGSFLIISNLVSGLCLPHKFTLTAQYSLWFYGPNAQNSTVSKWWYRTSLSCRRSIQDCSSFWFLWNIKLSFFLEHWLIYIGTGWKLCFWKGKGTKACFRPEGSLRQCPYKCSGHI